MTFTKEQATEIGRGFDAALHALGDLPGELLGGWLPSLKSQRAREYLAHGVCRRLAILLRCVENVFRICPVDRVDRLGSDDRTDLQINLHAFVINVNGLLDNLAWVTVFEASPPGFSRQDVGLFNAKLQAYLPAAAQTYLSDAGIVRWFKTYAKNYRDALAHRIPLYVPPSGMTPADAEKYSQLETKISEQIKSRNFEAVGSLLDEQARVGSILPAFVHSYDDDDASPPILFHPQLIADINTIVEIVRAVAPASRPA